MNFVMGALSFIFSPIIGFIGDLLKKIPGWVWLTLGLCALMVGLWVGGTYMFNRFVESQEKQIEQAQQLEKKAIQERDTALSNAEAYKAQRDSERASAEMARAERDALNASDAALQDKLARARAAMNAMSAQERAELGDPEKFAARLSEIQNRVDCKIDAINSNAAGCGQ